MPRMDKWEGIPEEILNIEVSRSWSDDYIEVGYQEAELELVADTWGVRPGLRYRNS
jgi:hypothetical protein